MASIGPSTITGMPPAAISILLVPKSWAPLWNRGVSAADKAENLPVVDDREHDAVAEPVDEPAGAGDGGHAGGGHFLTGDSAAAEMVDQSGPAGRCLAGPEAYVIGQVLAEPVGQVLVSP